MGGHKHCISGHMMFLVVEERDCVGPCLCPYAYFTTYIHHYYLSLKHVIASYAHTHAIFQDVDNILLLSPWRTYDLSHTSLQEQLTEITLKTFSSPSRNSDKKKKGKKYIKNPSTFTCKRIKEKNTKGTCKAFCIKHKCNNILILL